MRYGSFLPVLALIALAAAPLRAEFVATSPEGTRLPEAPVARIGGFRAVLEGLAGELGKARTHLKARGERRPATEALDRALHLAEFGHRARGLPREDMAAFSQALEAVRRARHELQMGRPDATIGVLEQVVDRLDPQALTDAMPEAGPAPGDEGLVVLNMHGHRLGELEGFGSDETGPTALIGHGGFWNMGETITPVPASALLAAEHFAILPAPVKKEDLGKYRLRNMD